MPSTDLQSGIAPTELPPAALGPPLCVDLDGTLLKTDLLWEGFFRALKQNLFILFLLPFWIFRGRAHLKHQIAMRAEIDFSLLPYRDEVLRSITLARTEGRRVVLVSAADRIGVARIAANLNCFNDVIASDGATNLSGATKRAALEKRFGHRGFDYIGDGAKDLPVWEAARKGTVVTDNKRLAERTKKLTEANILPTRCRSCLTIFLSAIRIHQWTKNLLVMVPIFTAHQLMNLPVLFHGALAFLSFSIVSSSVYLVNDLFDLESDRRRPSKRLRPLASGEMSLATGTISAIALLILGLSIAAASRPLFVLIIAIYYAASSLYSYWFKRVAVLDVLMLATLYTLRIFAGAAATDIVVSVWLLAFSMFLFFSLALAKRYAELKREAELQIVAGSGRGYAVSDLPQIAMLGICSGLLSILVLVLYVKSPEVTVLYRHPALLLLVCPLMLYWIVRVWIRATRGDLHEDPVVFALTDKVSYVAGALAVLCVYIATT